MSIENASVVDEMGILEDNHTVQLLINDEMDWEDESKHLKCIEAKINGYLDFWRSGQILKKYPHAGDFDVHFKVIFKYKLTEYATRVMGDIEKSFAQIGIGFSYDVLQIM